MGNLDRRAALHGALVSHFGRSTARPARGLATAYAHQGLGQAEAVCRGIRVGPASDRPSPEGSAPITASRTICGLDGWPHKLQTKLAVPAAMAAANCSLTSCRWSEMHIRSFIHASSGWPSSGILRSGFAGGRCMPAIQIDRQVQRSEDYGSLVAMAIGRY